MPSLGLAVENTALPVISELESRIERVKSDSSLPEAERLLQVESLQLVIKNLEQKKTFDEEAEGFAKSLQNAPVEQANLDAQLANYKRAELADGLSSAPLSKLESLLVSDQQQLTSSRSQLTVVDGFIYQEKTIDTQSQLSQAREQLNKAILDQKGLNAGQGADAIRQLLVESNIELQQSRIKFLEQRIFSRDARLRLLNSEKELLAKQIAGAEYRILSLKNLISGHRQNNADRLVSAVRSTLDALAPASVGLEIAQTNLQLAVDFKQLVIQQDEALNEIEVVSKKANRFEQKYASLIAQLKITQLESSAAFGAALRQQRDSHTNVEGVRVQLIRLEKLLTDSRLAQFKVDMAKEPEAVASYADEQRQKFDSEEGKTTADLDALLFQREQLLKQLSSGYSRYIDDLSKLIALLQTLNTSSQRYAELLDQQLLWMPSSERANVQVLLGTMTSFLGLIQSIDPVKLLSVAIERLIEYFLVAILVSVLLFLFLKHRRGMASYLGSMKSLLGKVQRDSIMLSVRALLITFVLAIPGPAMLLVLASLLPQESNPYTAISEALKYTSLFYLGLQFIIQSLRSDGLVGLHFKWDSEKRVIVKTNLVWLKGLVIPLMILTLYAEFQDSTQVRDDLGRVSFIVATLLSAFVAYRMFNPRQGILQPALSPSVMLSQWQFHYLVFPLVVMPPVILAFMSVVGYHYSALLLTGYLLQSIGIVVAGIFLFYLVRRAFSIGERRLALERAKAKRSAMLAQEEETPAGNEVPSEAGPIAIDMESIDVQTISLHTEALLKMVMVVTVGVALWHVWSDLIRAFERLDTIALWEVAEVIDGSTVASAITVWDLLLTVLVIVITYLAARNIPGLLEIAFLSRITLEPGSNYAITTMSRYIIVITGTFVALQLLGAQWSKLQWLIAALSVGLGFGLQEIVANFVSGIVILFERPIRIGDTITVGDQFGTVSRIRIRATTIVDWDRREIIIPNKTFITERLVNWTLTDPILRTIIDVGVAYGSDIELVEKSLMEIADQNQKVLEDPAPTALFRGFGDSTLNFQLRVFIKGIQELNPVIHELNVAIDNMFRERNIEIAFPQRDLHFDNKPLEVRLVSDTVVPDKPDQS